MPPELEDIDRKGLYYWCNYDQRAPLHSNRDCPGLNRFDEAQKDKFLNEVIIRGRGQGLNFCSMCCTRGEDTPRKLADPEKYPSVNLEAYE